MEEGEKIEWIDDDMITREGKRPDLSGYVDAFEVGWDGIPRPLFQPGERIAIEKRMTLLPGRPWLNTVTYMVEEINQEEGLLKLWNEDLQQWDRSHYITGIQKHGFLYKLLKKKAVQIQSAPTDTPLPKKRGRPPKSSVNLEREALKPPGAKKRGRPPKV